MTDAISLIKPAALHVKMWWEIARPKVLVLVLFTGLPMMGMSRTRLVDAGWAKVAVVLLATGIAGAASSAFNAWWERDRDAQMARTKRRPMPAAAMVPGEALGLATVLTLLSTVMLWAVGGALAAAVGLGTIAFYVLVYTIWLKPRTPQNIVIGGAAGATAPMIIEAAMDGRISAASLILFAIVFLWTPPHFWAIAIFRKEEYAAAGFPMMPNVIGDVATRRQSMVYTVLTVLTTLAPVPLGLLSPLYGVAALALGLWFAASVAHSMVADDPRVDWRLFKVSIAYLSLVFGAMLVDLVVSALAGPVVAPYSLMIYGLNWSPVL